MTRAAPDLRRALRALLCSALALSAVPLPVRANVEDERPNFVIVFADDLGYGDLGCFGNEVVTTPHLDRFAEEGLRLTAFYAGAPNCSPSRASLLTGRASARVGFYDYLSPKFATDMQLVPEEVTLAEVLREAGYATYHIGKWHLNPRTAERPALAHGFEHTGSDVTATTLVRRFGDWLRSRADDPRPFFAYIAPYECHEPIAPRSPAHFRAPYEGKASAKAKGRRRAGAERRQRQGDPAAYYGCVSQLDDAFGALLGHLSELGLDERTLVVFTSDNGPLRGTPDSWGSKGVFRGSKGDLFEGGLRVPAIVRWPGRILPGAVSDAPTHVWDLFPTLCDLAGVAPPTDRRLEGASLAPLFAGRELERRGPLFWSCFGSRQKHVAIRDGRWKLLAAYEPLPEDRTVMEHIRSSALGDFELYDVVTDPSERSDLAAAQPEVLERMRSTLLERHSDVMREGPTFDLEEYRSRAAITLGVAQPPAGEDSD